jgi:hypothetical protein
LTGRKEIENGYYLTVQEKTKLKALLAEQLTEKRKEVAELQRKLEEAQRS